MGKRTAAGALLLCACVLAGCNDNPTDNPDEFAIGVVEVRVGTQVARATEQGVEGRITLPIGDTIGSVVFFDVSGEEVDVQGDRDRNVIVTSGNEAIVTWTRLNKVTGMITALAVGTTTLSITLSHEDHNDFAPRPIPIDVVAQLP